MAFQDFVEEVQVLGRDLVDKVRGLIHEGNVRRVIIKDEQGHTFVEIPVTIAAVGAIAAPVLAAVGAISALVAKFTIVVERSEPKSTDSEAKNPGSNYQRASTKLRTNLLLYFFCCLSSLSCAKHPIEP
jgi:hypothetical protein